MQREAPCRVDRRKLGHLAADIDQMNIETDVTDPRTKVGNIVNTLRMVVTATLVGIHSGCRSFADLERLTANLADPVRKLLHLPRRLADTSASDVIVRLDVDELRNVLRKRILAAFRGKGLENNKSITLTSGRSRESDLWSASWRPTEQANGPEK